MSEPATGKVVEPLISKKRRRSKQGYAIPRVSFRRLVDEIASECKSDMRFQQDAIDALQHSAEDLIVSRFHRCSELADLCKRDTVQQEHWNFVQEEVSPC